MLRRRRGLHLIEALLALLVLSIGLVAMLTTGTQTLRAVALDAARSDALLALEELREAFSDLPRSYHEDRGFPSDPSEWNSLMATYLEDHPATLPLVPGTGSPLAATLQDHQRRIGLERRLLFQPVTSTEGAAAGIVTFLVRYRDGQGREREVRAIEVVW